MIETLQGIIFAIPIAVVISSLFFGFIWPAWQSRVARKVTARTERRPHTPGLVEAYAQKSEARKMLMQDWDRQFKQNWIDHGPKYRMGGDTIRDTQMLQMLLNSNLQQERSLKELASKHHPGGRIYQRQKGDW